MGEEESQVVMEDDIFSLPSPDRASVVTTAFTPHTITITSGGNTISTSSMDSTFTSTQNTASGSSLSVTVDNDHGYVPRLSKVKINPVSWFFVHLLRITSPPTCSIFPNKNFFNPTMRKYINYIIP